MAFRVQSASVHDGHAAKVSLTAAGDELLHGGARLRRSHAMQVAPVAGGVIPAPQLSKLAAVHTRRGERLGRFPRSAAAVRRSRAMRRGTDGWSGTDSPARIRREANDVGHLALERPGVGSVVLRRTLLHAVIVSAQVVVRGSGHRTSAVRRMGPSPTVAINCRACARIPAAKKLPSGMVVRLWITVCITSSH